ncbi:TetR family transcriptional regulator [Actinopolyspora erythraea]|uniref:TetR family transcriptional regulator n=1 Tax=Actinopolyspora erythraea TaxID=414996 RepID=A0A099D4G0_9ACTN|nr:TetR family transcriptional regulator [Actinopolyspora erythraea]ASU79584.1 TetR family transcriptional regulator [Actinopolyspora erythraea]KGI81023.1 TetR family transcriptional regulator [Actinopolyspora erythraea]
MSRATEQPRRVEYSESTRAALVESAVTLFTERGYAQASLDEITGRARVTKGALYHHFGGKRALFEAAFEAVEIGVVARLSDVMREENDPWEELRAGLDAFLRVCLEAPFQRIVAQEGPVVLGYQRWYDLGERYTFGLVRASVQRLVSTGRIEGTMSVDVLARVIFGGLASGAATIAGSDDPNRTSVEVGEALERLLRGLRDG